MASPLCKTLAIATRIAPYSETSCVITWISREFGRLATIFKGAYRPRSAFQGHFGLLHTSEIVFYQGAQHGVAHTGRECALVHERTALTADWRAAVAGLYLADLVTRLSPPEAPQPGLFDFFASALDGLAREPVTEHHLMWLEMKLLDQTGHSPRVTHCAACGSALIPGLTAVHYAADRGGLFCKRCEAQNPRRLTAAPPDVLIALQRWQKSTPTEGPPEPEIAPIQSAAISDFLGGFIAHHLDLPLQPRHVAFDLLAWRPVAAAG